MTLQQALHEAFTDGRLQAIFLLVGLDFVLGASTALYLGKFRLSYIADVLRNDLLGKALPFTALYVGWKLAPNSDILVSFINLEVIADGAFGLVVLALAGSILASLKELGLFSRLSNKIAGPDPGTPNVPPTPDAPE